MQSRPMSELEAVLGYTFRERELFARALTHSSHANEAVEVTGERNAAYALRRDNELLDACCRSYSRQRHRESHLRAD